MSLVNFREQEKSGKHLSVFLMLGDPTPEISVQLAIAAVAGGATMLELEIPMVRLSPLISFRALSMPPEMLTLRRKVSSTLVAVQVKRPLPYVILHLAHYAMRFPLQLAFLTRTRPLISLVTLPGTWSTLSCVPLWGRDWLTPV